MIELMLSRRIMAVGIVIVLAIAVSILVLPVLIPVRFALLCILAWHAHQLTRRHVTLRDPKSIVALKFDETHGWLLRQYDDLRLSVRLSPKSVASASWMSLCFYRVQSRKMIRVVLAYDSVSKQDWSALSMLVRFARPA